MPTCCLQCSNVTLSCNASVDSYIRESSLTYTGARGKILRWRGTLREGMNPYPMHDQWAGGFTPKSFARVRPNFNMTDRGPTRFSHS